MRIDIIRHTLTVVFSIIDSHVSTDSEKVKDREYACVAPCTTRGEDVVWPSPIVVQYLYHTFSHKKTTIVVTMQSHLHIIHGLNLQMLWCNGI
jgi:hypothetical protein